MERFTHWCLLSIPNPLRLPDTLPLNGNVILINGTWYWIVIPLNSGTSEYRPSLLWKPPKCGQEATVPNHFLKFTVHSDLCIAETSLLWLTDTKVKPQQTKSIQISLWKQTVPTYWYKGVVKNIWTLAISIHPTFQGLSALKLSNTVAYVHVTGEGRHITRCTFCIKDTSLLRTFQRGPAVSVLQRFHCIFYAGIMVK